MYLFKLEFLSFLDICPGVGLLDHMVTLIFSLLRNLVLFSIVATPIYISTNVQEGSRNTAFVATSYLQTTPLLFSTLLLLTSCLAEIPDVQNGLSLLKPCFVYFQSIARAAGKWMPVVSTWKLNAPPYV